MRNLTLVLAVLLPSLTATAQAPGRLGYQGRLLKADGTAETGVLQMRFALFADASGGSQLWSEEQSLALTDGFYATVLGETAGLPAGIFDGAERHLEVSLGTNPLLPRQRVVAVPYALAANVARDLKGGTVEAASLKVGGKEIVDSTGKLIASLDWSKLGNVPAGFADGVDDVGVTEVAARAPLSGSGSSSSPLAIAKATGASDGYLAAVDFARFDAKAESTHSHSDASASAAGFLSATDYQKFQAKADAAHAHSLASASAAGFLGTADWARFDGKLSGVKAGDGITVAVGTEPTVSVKFGKAAATVAEGNDPRFSLGARYHFEEGSGTTIADLSGNGNTLTLATTGVAWVNDGHTGKAVQFLGTSGGKAQASSSPSLQITEQITLEAWVFPLATVTYGPIVTKENSYTMSINGNQLQVGFYSAHRGTWEWQGSGHVPNNVWSHVAATYDGVAIRCYVNGVLTSAVSYPHGPLAANASALEIGGRAAVNGWFNGRIDEVHISLVVKSFQMNTLNGAYRVFTGATGELTTKNTWVALAEPTLNYTKKSGSSVLRIEYSDTMRATYTAAYGYMYGEVLIDDAVVASPARCYFAHHHHTNTSNNDLHIPTHILCYAHGVAAGTHKFSLRWYLAGNGQGYFGWERAQRILEVQELTLAP